MGPEGSELYPLVMRLAPWPDIDSVLLAKAGFLAMLLLLPPFMEGWTLALLAGATLRYFRAVAYHLCGMHLMEFVSWLQTPPLLTHLPHTNQAIAVSSTLPC